jgi:hypothetical protein
MTDSKPSMTPAMHVTAVALAFAYSMLLAGCSGAPARAVPPEIPSDAGQAAIARFDKNGDQVIDGAELDQVPSIKSAIRRFDRNQDNKVAADEIDARIQKWRNTKIGLMQVSVKVFIDGQPLSDAQVRIVPEEFLGTAVQPASALTDNTGRAGLSISDNSNGAGVQLGLYRIEISKKSGDKEIIPEKYNKHTQLGCEIAMDNSLGDGDWVLKLSSH